MKGLKALTAVLVGDRAAGERAPASAEAAAFKHYVGCGSRSNAKPSHVCPKNSKKGAFFKSIKADVSYTRLRQVPERQKPLRRKPRKPTQGTLYVNKITSTIPGKHQVTWFVEGKKSAPSSSGSRARAALAGRRRLRHRDRRYRRLRLARRRGSARVAAGALREGGRGTRPALLAEVERCGRRRGRLGARST